MKNSANFFFLTQDEDEDDDESQSHTLSPVAEEEEGGEGRSNTSTPPDAIPACPKPPAGTPESKKEIEELQEKGKV